MGLTSDIGRLKKSNQGAVTEYRMEYRLSDNYSGKMTLFVYWIRTCRPFPTEADLAISLYCHLDLMRIPSRHRTGSEDYWSL